MLKERIYNKYQIATDILLLLKLSSEIGWNGLLEVSIIRILYLCSVLYTFKYPKCSNPFSEEYEFTVELRGPHCDLISDTLFFLETNTYIIKENNKKKYMLNYKKIPNIEKMPNYIEKKEWIEIIIYILGVYGEEKIYEFIFRDPEYQNNLHRNEKLPINVKKDNKTIIVLNEFKEAFEKTLATESIKLDDKRYLELYFEYVFSKILKGEKDLW